MWCFTDGAGTSSQAKSKHQTQDVSDSKTKPKKSVRFAPTPMKFEKAIDINVNFVAVEFENRPYEGVQFYEYRGKYTFFDLPF